MKRHTLSLVIVSIALTLLLTSASTRGTWAGVQQEPGLAIGHDAPASYPLKTASGTRVAAGPIIIDFDTVRPVPQELRNPIERAVIANKSLLPATDRLTVSAFRVWSDWFEATLVPTEIVEASWEVELKPEQVLEVLGRRTVAGDYSAGLRGTTEYSQLVHQVPTEFIDFAKARPLAIAADYLFPWTSGQGWYKTSGWHLTPK